MSAPTDIVVKVKPANDIPPVIKISNKSFRTEVA